VASNVGGSPLNRGRLNEISSLGVAVNTREPDLTRQAQEIWEHNARWWDQAVGEGDRFQRNLVLPATERLLETRPDQRILDLGCGNGLFARRLAARGARVLACDFSPTFLELAKARTQDHADRIEYRQIDLTRKDEILSLGAREFDAAVCGLALMDMAEIEPLLEGLVVLLRQGGRFVFSVLHPCFNTTGTTLLAEQEDRAGVLRTTHSVRVTRYLGLQPEKGIGIPGQPALQYYFHRPLSVLFSACFRAGFVMTGIEEPAFSESADARPVNWESLSEIPPVLVVGMELRPRTAG
jgi:2-polyprenyl-3-methyl-5-hydroxy-6-metoxy-1,4-benzoquinol methylase